MLRLMWWFESFKNLKDLYGKKLKKLLSSFFHLNALDSFKAVFKLSSHYKNVRLSKPIPCRVLAKLMRYHIRVNGPLSLSDAVLLMSRIELAWKVHRLNQFGTAD